MKHREQKYMAIFILLVLIALSFLMITDYYELEWIQNDKQVRTSEIDEVIASIPITETQCESERILIRQKFNTELIYEKRVNYKEYTLIAQTIVFLLSFIGLGVLQRDLS